MESQRAIKIKGGTMRLGAYECEIKVGTKAYSAYKKRKFQSDIDIDMKSIIGIKKRLKKMVWFFRNQSRIKSCRNYRGEKSSLVYCKSISS